MLVFLAASVAALSLVPAGPAWACGKASFSPQSYTVGENDGSITLTIALVLNNPESRTRTIGYQTKTGTAKSGQDFFAKTGSVTFSPGDHSKTFTVNIKNDSTNEPTERFEVEVKPGPTNGCIEPGPDATVTIQDDDPKPKPSPTRDEGSDPPPSDPEPDPSTGSAPDPVVAEPSVTASASPTPSPTPSTSASSTASPAVSASGSFGSGGGLSAFALAGIALGAITIGSLAVAGVRRRFLVTQPPS
ncbi:MAG: Calx-beta domain-containing protein [Actinomycetota bacterium]